MAYSLRFRAPLKALLIPSGALVLATLMQIKQLPAVGFADVSSVVPQTITMQPARSEIVAQVAAPFPAIAASAIEQSALDLINDIRRERDLAPLAFSSELAAAAHAHSVDMAATGVMGHSGSNGSSPGRRITEAGYVWHMFGEVAAEGHRTPEGVLAAWMRSPTHQAVIVLPEFREFGSGLAYAADGRPYWTVNFGVH